MMMSGKLEEMERLARAGSMFGNLAWMVQLARGGKPYSGGYGFIGGPSDLVGYGGPGWDSELWFDAQSQILGDYMRWFDNSGARDMMLSTPGFINPIGRGGISGYMG